jgi:hypothetical protein
LKSLGGAPYAVRIRTDQSTDLRLLADSVRSVNPHQLRVFNIRRDRPNDLQDFIIGGTFDTVLGHYEALAAYNYGYFDEWHHRDMFWKDAYAASGGGDASAFFPRTRYLLDIQREPLRMMFRDRLSPLPRAIAAATYWRGKPLPTAFIATRMICEEQWPEERNAILANLDGPAVHITRWNRAHYVNVERMVQLGLLDPAEASAEWRTLKRLVCGAAARIRRPAMWK